MLTFEHYEAGKVVEELIDTLLAWGYTPEELGIEVYKDGDGDEVQIFHDGYSKVTELLKSMRPTHESYKGFTIKTKLIDDGFYNPNPTPIEVKIEVKKPNVWVGVYDTNGGAVLVEHYESETVARVWEMCQYDEPTAQVTLIPDTKTFVPEEED